MALKTELESDLFRLLVEGVQDYAIFLLDPDGRVQSWNAGAQRIKGYRADEVIGKHFSIFYPPEEARRGKPAYALRTALEEGRWADEGWRIRSDGSRFWASVLITALRDGRGRHVGFAKVTRDLSERKRAEEERLRLLEMERGARTQAETALDQLRAIQTVTEAALAHLELDALLATLLDRVSEVLNVDTVAILLLNEDEQVLMPRAAKGIEEEVVAGIPLPLGQGFAGRIAAERRPITVDDVEQSDVRNPILREKGVKSLLGAPLIVRGRVLGVLHVGTLYYRRFNANDVSFLQIVADRAALAIEHARLYEATRLAREEAEEAIRAVQLRDEFLSTAAHELKTPVTSLRGFAELLLRMSARGGALDSARFQRAVESIHHQAGNLSRLVTQLLEMSRLDGGHLELDRAPEDLARLVSRAVEQAQSQTERHTLTLDAPPELWAEVDAFRFEQVVANLLDNAIKYSPDGGHVEVELAQSRPGWVRLAVRDEGLGIPADRQSHIFERYYQAHAASHRSGLGLGLYLSRQIVERHGGRIWAESAEGRGSRFVVEVPARVVAEARA
ncbi:MAG TPA: ATP-binding protein [Chloroflexota bacterium]|nr:ATP-binding protein [Chloroflexota bacterium]